MSDITTDEYWTEQRKKDLMKMVPAEVARNGSLMGEYMLKCKMTGLNPFNGEIECIKFGSKYTFLVTAKGTRTIAQRSTDLGGIECTHGMDDKGNLLWVEALVKRGDRQFKKLCFLKEYLRPGPKWKASPYQMLSKCAEVAALRLAYSEYDGLYLEDEMIGVPRAVTITNKQTEDSDDLFGED